MCVCTYVCMLYSRFYPRIFMLVFNITAYVICCMNRHITLFDIDLFSIILTVFSNFIVPIHDDESDAVLWGIIRIQKAKIRNRYRILFNSSGNFKTDYLGFYFPFRSDEMKNTPRRCFRI